MRAESQNAAVPHARISDGSAAHWNVMLTASVKFEVVPGLLSLNHAWKFQVCPDCATTDPVGVGSARASMGKSSEPVAPEDMIWPGPL